MKSPLGTLSVHSSDIVKMLRAVGAVDVTVHHAPQGDRGVNEELAYPLQGIATGIYRGGEHQMSMMLGTIPRWSYITGEYTPDIRGWEKTFRMLVGKKIVRQPDLERYFNVHLLPPGQPLWRLWADGTGLTEW